jgi:histidinol dehydrogenase
LSEEDAVTRAARDIIDAVRARGDAALLEYTAAFDRLTCASIAELELGPDELAACARA